MANAEQVALLKKSVRDWNRRRDKDGPEVFPDLDEADLRGTNLRDANLVGAFLVRAILSGASLEGADITAAFLCRADLTKANLIRADLIDADLSGANLSRAKLGGANLRSATLLKANLSGADLGWANLGFADLRGADLRAAVLAETNLRGADLEQARMSKAQASLTIFADVDLSGVQGLETVVHTGPSAIGVDTILKSGGKIPDEFLRGCGVDPLIQKMLVGDGHSKSEAFTEWVARGHNPSKRKNAGRGSFSPS